jgi:RHS repeat-associated protein
MPFMKNLLFTALIIAISNVFTIAQTQQGASFILTQPLTGNQHYQASRFIEMSIQPGNTSGFKYTATAGNGEFKAEINPFLVVPPTEGEIGGPNVDDKGVVGSIAGVFNVSDMGQATYTIPINTPDDFKGLKPSLAVTYTSQSTNGLLGIGWNIAGISSISRTGSTLYHDNVTKGIKFDDTDNFILDGQRLMKVNNEPNGGEDCEYRTEQESFNRVFSKHSEYSFSIIGPESFVIQKKDGSKWYYGTTENSRMEHKRTDILTFTTNYLWLLDRVVDVKGNYIEYNYTKITNTGEIYIDAIKYTGFTNSDGSNTIAPNYEIKFEYKQRQDKEFAFIRDIKKENNQILDRILIIKQPENRTLYTYTMNYTYDGKYNCLHSVSLTDEFENSYNPLTFNWEKPQPNPTSQETLPTLDKNFLFSGDYNGDGFTDFLALPELTDEPYSSTDKLKLFLNDKNGGFTVGSFEKELDSKFEFIKICDLNGDLIADFLYCETTNSGAYSITPYIANGDGGFGSPLEPILNNDYVNSAVACGVGDFLGLGKSGILIKRAWEEANSEMHYAWKLYYYNGPADNKMDEVADGDIDNWGSINQQADFNGDGKTDIMIINGGNTKIYSFNYNASNNLIAIQFYNKGFPTVWHRVFTGDFNGDGRTDVLTYDIAGANWDIAYFKETDFDWPLLGVNIPGGDPDQYTDNLSYFRKSTNYEHKIIDFDGNGKDDVLTFKYTTPTVQNQSLINSAVFETHMNIAYMFPNKSILYETDKFINQTRFLRKTLQIGDFYGKGKADILIAKSTQRLLILIEELSPEFGHEVRVTQNFPTILKTYNRDQYLITDFDKGMGNTIYVEYDKLTSSDLYSNPQIYDFGSGIYDITIPLNVVKQTTIEMVESESASHVKMDYFSYEGLKLHTKGKGLLGFTKLVTSNNISNIIGVKANALNSSNAFLYPYTSTSYFQQIDEANIVSQQTFNFSRAVFPSIPKVFLLQLNWQRNHIYAEKGVFKKTEFTKYTYDSYGDATDLFYKYGNTTGVTQSMSKEKLYEQNANYEFKTETTFTYNDDPDYIDSWLVSLVEETKTIQSSNVAGSTPIKNSTNNVYYTKSDPDGFYPFIWKTIEKPDNAANHLLSVVNEFTEFDLRGNLLSSTTSAPNYLPVLQSRSSSIEYSDLYNKRFPTKTTNALENTATSTYDPVYGTLITSTGPNGLTTQYESNPLGTFSKTTSFDGIISITVPRWANNHEHAPVNALYYKWQEISGSPEVIVFYHKTGAELRSVTLGFDGSAIYVDKIYNGKGMLHKESMPYKKGEQPLYAEYEYDDYNRIETVTSPDNTTTTYDYAANEISVTINNGNITRETTKKNNSAGWLTESTDNYESIVKNEYYCNGNLSKTYIEGQPATTITFEYDHKGNRTILNDPNYGIVKTVFNAYGELEQNTNPRNETINFKYDKLGRKTDETGGPEGSITWTYSNTPGRIGTLENIIKNNHRTNFIYNDYLRLVNETEIINGTSYITGYTYDELGRTSTTTHPTGITLCDGYNVYGFPTTVSIDKYGKQLWKTENVNSMGLVTKFKIGNGLITDQTYYPITMRPYTVKTAKAGSTPIQDLEYGWYELGNLKYREKWINRDEEISRKESFTYDGLDRLESISLNNAVTGYHSYDISKLGNMTYKYTDGNTIFSSAQYGTDGFGPHAITQLSTDNPLLTGPQQDITYNGYDKVSTIIEGVHTLAIQYGHQMQRISQQYTDGTNTIEKVWAGACEYITKNGQQYKHTYLSGPMGLFAIHIINPDGTEEINYIHKDHLGSWHTITDESGNLLQEQSFDAWGNRRNPDSWHAFTGTAPEPLFDRGFTGHEHLYAFGLINMNGRMYDPVLGRMLSPDNFMQAPDFSQSFNRYSYCINNPLRYTDPGGQWFGGDDAVVAGAGFVFGYVSYGITHGDWGGKAFLNGGIMAASAWIGYNTCGIATAGQGLSSASAPAMMNYIGSMAFNTVASSIMPSMNIPISNNFSISISPGFGLGPNGLSGGMNVAGTYTNGDWTVSGGFGANDLGYSVSGGASYYDKETRKRYSYYINYFGGRSDGHNQMVGGIGYSRDDYSFRWENDFFAHSGDKWRTNAMEFSYKKFVIGTNLWTNDPKGEKSAVDNEGRSKVWGRNWFGKGAWEDGITYSSPLYIGLRSGNGVTRIGIDHPLVQEFTQNFIHKFSGVGSQNFYNKYAHENARPYTQSGYYNPFSLYFY